MTDAAPAGERRHLALKTAADFFAALRSPDLAARLATLRAVVEAPDKALAFGRHDGRDVVDELIAIINASPASMLTAATAVALFVFDDPRSLAEAKKQFVFASDMELRAMASERIGREPDVEVIAFFAPFLRDAADAALTPMAARALAGREPLDASMKVKIAVASGSGDVATPDMDESNIVSWLAELNGPWAAAARGRLMVLGERAFVTLRSHWEDFDSAKRIWLLGWGARAFSARAVDLVVRALESGDEPLTLAALEVIPEFGLARGMFYPLTAGVEWERKERRFQLAAVRAGSKVEGLIQRARAERDPELRLAFIARLAEEGSEASLRALAELMADPDWRVRGAAAIAMAAFGERAVPAARSMLDSPDMGARTAAAQTLLRLGRKDILETLIPQP